MLLVVAVVLVIGSFLPKIDFLQPHELERLKENKPYHYKLSEIFAPTRIVRSYPFIIIWLLLLNSTTVCTYRRIIAHFRLQKVRGNKGTTKALSGESLSEELSFKPGQNIDDVINRTKIFLKNKRWSVESASINDNKSDKSDAVYVCKGTKGGLGFWGSIVFHVSLILLFIGAGVSGLTRLSATLLATENYVVPLEDTVQNIAQEPIIGKSVPGAIISLKKIDTKYGEAEQLVDFSADITISSFYGKMLSKKIKVNQPLNFEGFSILPNKYGISPLFILKKNGKSVDVFNSNLGDGTPKVWTEKGTFDSFYFGEQDKNLKDLRVKVQFIPNLFIEDKKVYSKGSIIKNPAMILTIINDKKNKEIATNLVKKGESVKFEDYELIFQDLNYWGHFIIVRDQGMPIIIFAMFAGLAGIVIRFIYHDKNLWISFSTPDGENRFWVKIAGKSKYFPALFKDELKQLKSELGSLLNK